METGLFNGDNGYVSVMKDKGRWSGEGPVADGYMEICIDDWMPGDAMIGTTGKCRLYTACYSVSVGPSLIKPDATAYAGLPNWSRLNTTLPNGVPSPGKVVCRRRPCTQP